MDEREDPRRCLRALGRECRSGAPDRQERLLDGVLGEPVVAQHAERETERGTAHAVVERGERRLVAPRNESDQGFLGKVRELVAHRLHPTGPGQRYHGYGCCNHRERVRRSP